MDHRRDLASYADDELARMSPLELARLALAAEDQAWAVYLEHQDEADGAVPEHARRRSEQLSALAERFAALVRDARRERMNDPDG
jgi:hypothetical protein